MSMDSAPPHGDSLVFLGDSPAMVSLRADIEAAAKSSAKVLIVGETGSGKEVVARLIHQRSVRAVHAFVAVNCSGIPETLLESELFGHTRGSFTGAYRDKPGVVRQAHRGTLFLDELAEMSLRMQAVLLRFAETGEIQTIGGTGPAAGTDVRLITATNRDLRSRIETGAFREDLYYRLDIVHIDVPPLRQRAEDVILLLDHYLRRISAAHHLRCPELAPNAQRMLMAYAWPGNVRELKNLAERLVVRDFCRPVIPDDLPAEMRDGPEIRSTSFAGRTRSTADLSRHAKRDDERAEIVDRLWERLIKGEDFWTVVYQPFKARTLTRDDIAAVIHIGLQHTRGSYRALLAVFGLPPTDYKRFHAFLYQNKCNLPVAPYRQPRIAKRA